MINSLIIALVFLLSMTCHAQKISMSDLVGKTWVADSGYDGCGNIDWNIVFSAKSSEHKFVGKSDNKVSVFTYNTYLCSYNYPFDSFLSVNYQMFQEQKKRDNTLKGIETPSCFS